MIQPGARPAYGSLNPFTSTLLPQRRPAARAAADTPKDGAELSAFDPADRVRVLVVGDPGTGKTSLVHLACQQEALRRPPRTVGCAVDVAVHSWRRGGSGDRAVFVEFFDLAGHTKHWRSLAPFCSVVDGIVLVHDLTNRKSFENLASRLAQLREVSGGEGGPGGISDLGELGDLGELRHRGGPTAPVAAPGQAARAPVLVVGTRLDMLSAGAAIAGADVDMATLPLDAVQRRHARAVRVNARSLESFALIRDELSEFLDHVVSLRGHGDRGR